MHRYTTFSLALCAALLLGCASTPQEHQLADGSKAQLFDQMGDVLGFELLVKDAVGLDDHDRSLSAKPVASGFHQQDLFLQPLIGNLLFQGLLHLSAPG